MNLEIIRTEPQKEFMESDAKFRGFVSGVGGGKTSVGWMCVLEYAFQNPGSLGAIVAPSYPLIRDVIIKERPNWIPDALVRSYNKTDKELKFINGSSVIFKSAKDEAQIDLMRGLTLAYAWIDEVTLLPKLTLEVLMARLRQPGFKPKLWMTGTPRKGWVHDLLKKDPSEEWFVLDEIPSQSNTFLDPGYVKSLKDLYTGQFYDQEVMGLWIDFEGLIWNVAISDEMPVKPSRTIYGIDIGFTHPTAITVVQQVQDRYYVVDEFYASDTNDADFIKAFAKLVATYGPGDSFVDPSVPRIIKLMREHGYRARGADNSVMDGLRTVRALFDTGKLFVHPRCINLIHECGGYVWSKKNKEAPIDIHNDAADSLRYNLMGATSKKQFSHKAI